MKFEELIDIIERTNLTLRKQALSSLNQSLVIRNWIVGFYLVEFEQNGEDYAHYGEMLLETIAKRLKKKRIKGFSLTNLKLYRQFYLTYPQIGQPVADQFKSLDAPIKSMFLGRQKSQPAAGQLESAMSPAGDVLLHHFTFRHFTELIKVKDPVKRAFYENETIKTHWSTRQLKRQIESLLIERIGLSRNKEKLLESVRNNNHITTVEETIKDPYVLDFTGFKDLPVYTENDLETALLDKIHDFLIELGNGFCFEARQKRITVGNEHDKVDLVFYHRILKCHILIELKVRAFAHSDVGQMNFYLNYFKNNVMEFGDNPPVGIILCTEKQEVKVEYATAGLDNQLFVSKYMVELPDMKVLKEFLESYIDERYTLNPGN
jgi:predicted nuclease of restriction endonuclease-like (RecB) superfamily